MTLSGLDNGQLEQREILFAPSVMPRVSIFEDSTAKRALQPQSTWAQNTSNPLGILKLMLESSIEDNGCAAETWGYDGKRRYLLRLERSKEGAAPPERLANGELFGGEIASRHVCKITMNAEKWQKSASDSKPSILAGRLAALWPFEGGDREFLFDFSVYVNSVEHGPTRLMLNEIKVNTPIGEIIGRE